VSPTSPMPRKNPSRRSRRVEEHRRRRGDPVEGGGSRKPIVTAYRQSALACAAALAQGPRRPQDLKVDIPDAPKILHGNVYGWFVPSSGESTPWPSPAEPHSCAGHSRRRRPQFINDRSEPGETKNGPQSAPCGPRAAFSFEAVRDGARWPVPAREARNPVGSRRWRRCLQAQIPPFATVRHGSDERVLRADSCPSLGSRCGSAIPQEADLCSAAARRSRHEGAFDKWPTSATL
jgi:hypothetical protein